VKSFYEYFDSRGKRHGIGLSNSGSLCIVTDMEADDSKEFGDYHTIFYVKSPGWTIEKAIKWIEL
jgi:hypothetical protein